MADCAASYFMYDDHALGFIEEISITKLHTKIDDTKKITSDIYS